MNDTAPKAAAAVTNSLPYVDRRSLSEAWYSALHLASDGPALASAPERRAVAQSAIESQRAPLHAREPRGLSRAPVHHERAPGSLKPMREAVASERAPSVRRAPDVHPLARPRSYAPFHTSLTVGLERHRVQLLLRRDGATLHVVALCSPAVADVVRRALACAGVHLRRRGEAMRASIHVVECAVALA